MSLKIYTITILSLIMLTIIFSYFNRYEIIDNISFAILSLLMILNFLIDVKEKFEKVVKK